MAKKDKDNEPKKTHAQILQEELDADQKEGHHYGYVSGKEVIEFPEIISTGSLFFDIALEGGYRCGWSRFSGDPQMGKSAQGLAWAAQWQKKFGEDAFVVVFNAEGRITSDLIRRSGVNTDPKYFVRIDTNVGDYIIDKIINLVTKNPFGKRYFFLTDSSDAMIRAHDLDKTAGQAEKIGGGATLLSYAGKRLSLPISKLGHHFYLTSQLRDKMNAMAQGAKGESSGNAPKFYSSLSGRMRKWFVKGSEDGNIYGPGGKIDIIGHKTKVELYKSPNEVTFTDIILHIKRGQVGGIWKEYELLALCEMWNLVESKGAWFSASESLQQELSDEKIISKEFKAQGELGTVRFLESEPTLVDYLTTKLKNTLIHHV